MTEHKIKETGAGVDIVLKANFELDQDGLNELELLVGCDVSEGPGYLRLHTDNQSILAKAQEFIGAENIQAEAEVSEAAAPKDLKDILIALNSTDNLGDKYPFGNKELTEKVKQYEAAGYMSYNDKTRKWSKGKGTSSSTEDVSAKIEAKAAKSKAYHEKVREKLMESSIGVNGKPKAETAPEAAPAGDVAEPKVEAVQSAQDDGIEGTVVPKHGEYFAKKSADGKLHHIVDKELGKKLFEEKAKIKFYINEMDDAVDIVTSNFFEKEALRNDFNGKVAHLKKHLPKVFKGIMQSPMADSFQGGINGMSYHELSNGKTIYYIDTPQHGFYFDDKGALIGEEDGGLEGDWAQFNQEIRKQSHGQVTATTWNEDLENDQWAQKAVFNMSKTFDMIDPNGEAIKDGMPEETGFEWEDKQLAAVDVLETLYSELGFFENFQPGANSQSLYGTDPDTDPTTGQETRYAMHIEGEPEDMQKLNSLIEKYLGSGDFNAVQSAALPEPEAQEEAADATPAPESADYPEIAKALEEAGFGMAAGIVEDDSGGPQGPWLDVSKDGETLGRFWIVDVITSEDLKEEGEEVASSVLAAAAGEFTTLILKPAALPEDDETTIEVSVDGDGIADIAALLAYLNPEDGDGGGADAPAEDGQEKMTESGTWKEDMGELSKVIPGAEKMIDKLWKVVDALGIAEVNRSFTDSMHDDDKKIEGQDFELPHYMAEAHENFFNGSDTSNRWINIWTKSTAGSSLNALADKYPEVKEWVADPENAKLSFGETDGMMPYEDANYPKDAILLCIDGEDTDTEVNMLAGEVIRVLGIKKKDMSLAYDFLNKMSELKMGPMYGLNTKTFSDPKDEIYFSTRTQYNYATYFKLKDVEKVVRKAVAADKDKESKAASKQLMDQVREGAGDWK